jgi:hypothetical protein
MSFEQTFSKSSKAAVLEFKTTAGQMISNGSKFSVQCLDISAIADDSTVYPGSMDLTKWTQDLLLNEIKSRPLPQKALEEMARKGLKPKKEISELILVSIVPSKTHIHVGVSTPAGMLDPVEFTNNALESYLYDPIKVIDNKVFVDIPHSEPLKERDTILRCFFTELKRRKIYIDEEEEDDDGPFDFPE